MIGTIANFYATKDLATFIKAINLLVNSQNLPLLACVIGEGELRSDLENLIANYNLKNHFLLLGRKAVAADYLKAFDIYVCSSVKEGFPYTILEAMAAELPIVSTEVGGIPEMIQNQKDGLLIKPKDHQALAGQIKYLIDHPLIGKQLAQRAGEKVTAEFSQKQMIAKTYQEY